jgi:hypothetical protein
MIALAAGLKSLRLFATIIAVVGIAIYTGLALLASSA